jgi:hypothetical protein
MPDSAPGAVIRLTTSRSPRYAPIAGPKTCPALNTATSAGKNSELIIDD